MPDFPVETIEIRYLTAKWGPYNFDLTDALPSGTVISEVTVRSFLGKLDKGDSLDAADAEETTDDIIETAQCVVADDTTVDVYFKFPTGETDYYSSTGVVHTLVFEITLDTEAEYPFYFHQVVAYE